MPRYGQFTTFEVVAGKAAELKRLLLEASRMAIERADGCDQYTVCEDDADRSVFHVFELWKTKKDHDDSLHIPEVQALVSKALPLLAGRPESRSLMVL